MGTGEETLASECPYHKMILQRLPPVSQIFQFQLHNDTVFILLLFPSKPETSQSTLDCGRRKYNPFSAEGTRNLVLPPQPIFPPPTILQKMGVSSSFFWTKPALMAHHPVSSINENVAVVSLLQTETNPPVWIRCSENKPTKPDGSGF